MNWTLSLNQSYKIGFKVGFVQFIYDKFVLSLVKKMISDTS